jgi:hypothetical protein
VINWFKRLLQWREVDITTHESLPYSKGRSKMPLVKTPRYNQWVVGGERPSSVDYNFMRLHKDA